MTNSPPPPSVNEKPGSIEEISLGPNHLNELLAGHHTRLDYAELIDIGDQPDAAADLHGEVGILEHDVSPFAEKNITDARAGLLKETAVDRHAVTPPPQSHVVTIDGRTVEIIQSIYLRLHGWQRTFNTPGSFWMWRREFSDIDEKRRAYRPATASPFQPYGLIMADRDCRADDDARARHRRRRSREVGR